MLKVLVTISAIAVTLIAAQIALAAPLVIVGGTIIDGTGRAPFHNHATVIENGRIKTVGTGNTTELPESAQQISAEGKYIIPGLMDANVHLFPLFIILEPFIQYEDRYDDLVVEAAQLTLKSGLTTVFDTWGPREPLAKAQKRINSGAVMGSRVFYAGNIIGLGGPLTADFLPAPAGLSLSFVNKTNAMWEQNMGPELMWLGPDQMRERMREYLSAGVSFVKYAASGHMESQQMYITFSPRVQQTIVDEAHHAHLTVQAHVTSVESENLALEAGVDILTHCELTGSEAPFQPLPDETIHKILDRKVACSVLPLTNRGIAARNPGEHGYFNEGAAQAERRNLEKLIKAGVPLSVSTDAFLLFPPEVLKAALPPSLLGVLLVEPTHRLGEGHFNALKALREAGMAPMEILKSATLNIAKAYKKDREIGSLERGKVADVVILDRNPLDDVENYRSIRAVIKDGVLIDIASLPTAPLISSTALAVPK